MITADKVLSEPQLNKLIKILKAEKDKSLQAITVSNKRNPKEVRIVIDYFLFTLISYTGLRISEALNLKKSDVHFDFIIVRAEISKNKKKGTVYFGTKTRKLLDDFFQIKQSVLKRDFTEYVFSLNGIVPSRSYCHTRFKYWLNQVGLPGQLSIHSLRHTYGTLCIDNGLSLTFVRDNLRHANISITSQYLHLTKENREKIKDLF